MVGISVMIELLLRPIVAKIFCKPFPHKEITVAQQ